MTAGFAPAIARVAADLIERWENLSDGGIVEIKAEMSRVALEALVGCIFSEGLGDPKAVRDATTRSMCWAFPISCRASRGSACSTCCAPFTRRSVRRSPKGAASQCLDRGIPDKQTLIEEIAAWKHDRNANHTKADWQFTTKNHRLKLKHL